MARKLNSLEVLEITRVFIRRLICPYSKTRLQKSWIHSGLC